MSHEMTHWLEKHNPDLWRSMNELVFETLREADEMDEVTRIENEIAHLDSKIKGKKHTADEARSEIMARACEDMLSMSENGKQLFNSLSETEQKTLVGRIKELIKNITDWIDRLLKDYKSTSYEAELMRGYKERLTELSKLWDKALENAKVASQVEMAQKYTTGKGDVKMAVKDDITLQDIKAIQSIGRKSINDFTSEDIKKTEAFARRYFKEMGVKSPFFRAWFGDWRANDTSLHIPTEIPQGVKLNISNHYAKNADTGWEIHVTETVEKESLSDSDKEKPYIQRLLSQIDTVLKRSILLDSAVSEPTSRNKKGSTAFMHYLYSVIEYNGNPFLAKIAVEEYNIDSEKRAYNVERIKMSALSRLQYDAMKASHRNSLASNADGISVADLFELVKTYDKKFHPKPVNEALLNEDGTPKVFYHGSNQQFYAFKNGQKNGWLGKGIYFAEEKAYAKTNGKNLSENYLSARNSFVVKGDSPSDAYSEIKEAFPEVNELTIKEVLEKHGYDSIIFKHWDFGHIVSVFSPTQIKSATDNIGTFDGSNSDIRFSLKKNNDGGLKNGAYSNSFVTDTLNGFGIQKIGDYLYVQKQVMKTLAEENFFTDAENRRRIEVNKDSGMVIEINKSGIDETFDNENYARVGKDVKITKLATIRRVPEIIKNGKVILDDIPNQYNPNDPNKRFAYIEHTLSVDGKEVTLRLDIKKSPQKNKFWVHRVLEIENASNLPASTIKDTEAGYAKADIGNNVSQPEQFVKKKFSLKEENNQKAIEYFGKTYSWAETGYLTPNGTKLDFSGRKDGASGGYRTVDHREILDIMGDFDSGTAAMIEFMEQGNIRIMPESNGINLSVEPTKEQYYALDDFISKNRGEVIVDFDDTNGNTIASIEYPKGTRSTKVISDMKQYFAEGRIPEISDVQRFRFSLKDDSSPYDYVGETERLQKENETLKGIIQDLKERISLSEEKVVSTNAVVAAARAIKKYANSNYDTVELGKKIKEVCEYVYSGKSNPDEVFGKSSDTNIVAQKEENVKKQEKFAIIHPTVDKNFIRHFAQQNSWFYAMLTIKH